MKSLNSETRGMLLEKNRLLILKLVLDFTPVHFGQDVELLKLRMVSRDFLRLINNFKLFPQFGASNTWFRMRDGMSSMLNSAEGLSSKEVNIDRRFSKYALRVLNFMSITFVYDSREMDCFLGGRKFQFVKKLEFEFPHGVEERKRFCDSLSQFTKFRESFTHLKNVSFSLSKRWWNGRKCLGFLDYFKDIKFQSLSISHLKHPLLEYATNDVYKLEPIVLHDYLKRKKEITSLHFDFSVLYGDHWKTFFKTLSRTSIQELNIGLYRSTRQDDELLRTMLLDPNPESKLNEIVKEPDDHPLAGLWANLESTKMCFFTIKKLVVDDDIFFIWDADKSEMKEIKPIYDVFFGILTHKSSTVRKFVNTGNMNFTRQNVKQTLFFFGRLKVLELGIVNFDRVRDMELLFQFVERNCLKFRKIQVKVIKLLGKMSLQDFQRFVLDHTQDDVYKCTITKRDRMIRLYGALGWTKPEMVRHFQSIEYFDNDMDQKGFDIMYYRFCSFCRVRKKKKKKKRSEDLNLRLCSRCKKVFYCSRICQTNDWRNHKKRCKK